MSRYIHSIYNYTWET